MLAYQVNKPARYEKIELPLINKWVESLRSGRFKKSKGFLFDGKGFCCLGVLCISEGCDRIDIENQKILDRSMRNLIFGSVGLFPRNCSVTSMTGGENIEHYSLAALNDNSELTFSQIADVIEEFWNPVGDGCSCTNLRDADLR